MTTIAGDWYAGLMVSDSKLNIGDSQMTVRKIRRVKGAIIGSAGTASDCLALERLYFAGEMLREGDNTLDAELLILRPSGLFYVDARGFVVPIASGRHAIGSGGQGARAAMLVGADVRTAVKIAISLDPYSGLPIRKLELKIK